MLGSHENISARVALALVTLTIGLLAVTAGPANARPTIGIGENGYAMFSDPNFQKLGSKISRKVLPWDFYKYDYQVADLRAWINGAKSQNIEPMIAINHGTRSLRQLPSLGQYRYTLRSLQRDFPEVRTLTVWNEANHHTQPTARNPKRAAQYFKLARQICRGCKIVAADVLDQKNMLPWIAQFKKFAGSKARLWGLHSYADSNRKTAWRNTATLRLLNAVKGKLWLTEVGGIVNFGTKFRYNERRAAASVSRTLSLSRKSRRIQRVYLYTWYGSDRRVVGGRAWDSGLVSARGEPRRGYSVLRNWIRRYGA